MTKDNYRSCFQLCGSITGCITKLDAGQEYTYELVRLFQSIKKVFNLLIKSNRTLITFTNGEDGLTMAILGIEYMTYKGLDDYYGVNIAAGFDTGVQISSTK